MIQRIQSIWLLLAALVAVSLLFVPTVGLEGSEGYFILNGSGLKNDNLGMTTNYPLLISNIAAALVSVANIFNFRNRKLQIRLIWINILLLAGLGVWIFLLAKSVIGLKVLDIEMGVFVIPVAIIFLFLALRGVKNDEKLIRSADRLR
jgi:hypothetical protein